MSRWYHIPLKKSRTRISSARRSFRDIHLLFGNSFVDAIAISQMRRVNISPSQMAREEIMAFGMTLSYSSSVHSNRIASTSASNSVTPYSVWAQLAFYTKREMSASPFWLMEIQLSCGHDYFQMFDVSRRSIECKRKGLSDWRRPKWLAEVRNEQSASTVAGWECRAGVCPDEIPSSSAQHRKWGKFRSACARFPSVTRKSENDCR